jgi:hypothetical protein
MQQGALFHPRRGVWLAVGEGTAGGQGGRSSQFGLEDISDFFFSIPFHAQDRPYLQVCLLIRLTSCVRSGIRKDSWRYGEV